MPRNQRRFHRLLSAALTLIMLLSLLPVAARSAAQAGQPTAPPPAAPGLAPEPVVPAAPVEDNALQQALFAGDYPAQLVSSTGAVQANRYGPQRNDPAEGIPEHAYSPFDERNNREYPCPPGGCDAQPGQVLVKLADDVALKGVSLQGAWTTQATLNAALLAQGVVQLQPIFPNASAPKLGAFVESPLGERMPMPDLTRWFRATLADDKTDVLAVAQALGAAPGIAYAEPDYLRKPVGEPATSDVGARHALPLPQAQPVDPVGALLAAPLLAAPLAAAPLQAAPLSDPNDPLYAQQWHLAGANVPAAWAYLESQSLPPGGNRDIIVAVIDTGVDYTHPDLAANMWVNAPELNGAPGVDDDGNGYVDDIYGADTVYPDGDPRDDHGHGTHVAGIIAAQANNSIGGVGVAYNCQIMALKAAQYSGVLVVSDIAEAIYYAVEKGADVINMSFGGYARSRLEEDALSVAFGQAVLVAAAGNDSKVTLPCERGRDMYPAAYNWVLGVMARAQYPDAQGDYLAGFSNYDCTPQDTHEYELMAPGVQVWSTLPNSEYAAWSGTSMAAPVVAGIAALARTKWADKNAYSSRFIMGQLATTGSLVQAYTPVGMPAVSYRVSDAYTALTTVPQPALSYLQLWLFDTSEQGVTNDSDGIVDAGETVDLAIVIRNYWGKADPVTVTLEARGPFQFQPDPYVTMITDTVGYGAIGSFNWDDNGLIYDADGVAVGVSHPFRFTTDSNTPNDHVIPFRLTISAGNGFDLDDPNAPYIFSPSFNLIVQRGRELPRIIAEDLVLTKDYFWIVGGPTLIESGVAVTVTEGTQVQWGTATPSDPYATPTKAALVVDGTLLVQGTLTEPVELFSSELLAGVVTIDSRNQVHTSYARVREPYLRNIADNDRCSVDHCYFDGDLIGTFPALITASISNSILHKLQHVERYMGTIYCTETKIGDTNLYDSLVGQDTGSGWVDMNLMWRGIMMNSVFLQDNAHSIRQFARVAGANAFASEEEAAASSRVSGNAFLSRYWYPNPSAWMQIWAEGLYRNSYLGVARNYWGTTSTTLIDAAIWDYSDNFDMAHIVYQPILTTPLTTTYPFVVDVTLTVAGQAPLSGLHGPTPLVAAEPVTFTVTFNRDMDPAVQPAVSFGPDVPLTDYTIHPIDGGWQDARTWAGTFSVNPITGDGYQLIRVAGAVAADDPWLVTGDDAGRFRFEVITSGTESMNLQATGGEGYIDLSWTQTDFDLLAGFNLYRATTLDGAYSRINPSIIPPEVRAWRDTSVTPGQPYYYKFTIVKSDMSESDYSNVATATPTDTIPPVITHTPVTSAQPGLPLSLNADVTDNVGVQAVTLYYRRMGQPSYASKAMTHTTGDRYTATIEGANLVSPGVEYYITAFDGVSTVYHGRPELPHAVSVVDRPVVTGVSPSRGPATGGTTVTIAGTNLKAGATVTFGGAAASQVTVQSSSQLTCTTPAHYPETVDVTVTNPDAQSGTRLQAFTYESDVASVGLPAASGGQTDVVQVPVNAANIGGLAGIDLTVTFDAAVLTPRGASTGTLTPGWSQAVNTTIPGRIVLSMASPGGTATGSGTLALLEFEVVGAPGVTTTLHFSSLLLNDGAIAAQTSDGSFQVDEVFDVAGTVRYWSDSAGVPGVDLALTGARAYTTTGGIDGTYTVASVRAGAYTLTPSKTGDANGISAYDASLVLRHAVGLETLTGHAFTAGDVNKSGAITSMDAYYILQKAVDLIGLPFPGAGVVWEFSPASKSYGDVNADLGGQDFAAILLGDPSGNWSAGAGLLGGVRLHSGSATLTLPDMATVPGAQITMPLTLALTGAQVYGVDLTLTYDAAVLSSVRVVKGALASSWSMYANLSTPGVVRVSMAGSSPIVTEGELLRLVFDVEGAAGTSSALTLTRADLNEGAVSTTVDNGLVTVYTPVDAAFTASPTSGVAPLAVTFSNSSTGDFASSLWTFGDGVTSTLASPVHTYQEAGAYTVTLQVSGLGGTDTHERAAYISVSLVQVTGNVTYWQGGAGVPGVALSLVGARTYTTTTQASGAYTLGSLKRDGYTLTPSKVDQANGISAYDASLVLQHSAGGITLTGHAATAADVNKNGIIAALDASYMLQRSVGLISLPFTGTTHIWEFAPANRTFADLNANATGQDFVAILLGDPSGNWSAAAGALLAESQGGEPVLVRVQDETINADGSASVTLWVDPAGQPLYSLEAMLSYDPSVVRALQASGVGAAGDWLVAANTTTPGQIKVALAGATPISSSGALLTLRFRMTRPEWGNAALRLVSVQANEGALSAQGVDGRLARWRFQLPLVQKVWGGQ